MTNEENIGSRSNISLKNVELFLLRILAGSTPLHQRHFHQTQSEHPEIMSALQKLVREGKEL